MPKKPVMRILSVNAIVNGVNKTLIEGIDYNLMKDTKSIYANTIYANDRIEFLRSNSGTPDTGTEVSINFSYNSLIEDCQVVLNNNLENYLILGELLVSQTEPVILDIETNIKLKYSYDTEVVKNEILTSLSNYILTLPLGQDISQEDIFTFLSTTYSEYISGITYPFIKFEKRNSTIINNLIIELNYGQYLSLDSDSLKITFE